MISAAAFGPRQAEQDWNNSAGSCFIVLQKAASSLGIYTEEGRHVTSIPVGRHPHEMVVSPDGRYVFTTNNGTMRIEQAGEGGNTVSIIDLKARRRVREVSLGKYHRPHGIDFDPRAGQIFVTCENPDRLLITDPETRSVIQDYETGGQTSHLVTLSRDGKKPHVSNSRSDNLSAIDLQSRAIKLVRTGARPEGSVLSKDGTRLYVVNRDSNTISVIHTGRDEKIGEIGTG